MFFKKKYPPAVDPAKVGKYDTEVFSGGGYFYDEVVEYRVWVKDGAKRPCYSFPTYEQALKFSRATPEAEPPVVLVLQKEYVAEEQPGKYRHVRQERIAEWQVGWLKGNRNNGANIQAFMSKVAKNASDGNA